MTSLTCTASEFRLKALEIDHCETERLLTPLHSGPMKYGTARLPLFGEPHCGMFSNVIGWARQNGDPGLLQKLTGDPTLIARPP